MISEKMMKSCSVIHVEQNMEFEKFNCLFIDSLRFWENESYFDRGWKRVYTRHNLADLLCISIDYFYMIRGSTEGYFLADCRYILENHFYIVNAPGYCFKRFLSRIFCVNSSIKVLPPQYEDPSTHIFRISSLCTFFIYRKKEIGFVVNFFSKYFFGPKIIPHCFQKFPGPVIKLNWILIKLR